MNFSIFSFYRLLKNVTHWPDAFTPCYSPGSWIRSILLFHPKRILPGVWKLNTSHLTMSFHSLSFKIMSCHSMSLSEMLLNKIYLLKCHLMSCNLVFLFNCLENKSFEIFLSHVEVVNIIIKLKLSQQLME